MIRASIRFLCKDALPAKNLRPELACGRIILLELWPGSRSGNCAFHDLATIEAARLIATGMSGSKGLLLICHKMFLTKFAPQSFDYILGTMLITDLLLWIKRKHKSGFNSNHYNMDKFLKQLILTCCQIPDHHFTKHQTKTQTQSLQPLIKILAVVKRYLLTVRSTS